MKKAILTAVLFTFLLANFTAEAQFGGRFTKKTRYLAIGVTANVVNYVGDLDPSPFFISPGLKFTRPNLGLVVQYRINSRMFLRGSLSWGNLAGSDVKNSGTEGEDRFRRIRNLSFRNHIFEFKGDLVVDLYENLGRYEKRPEFTPYGFIGLGVFRHNPQAELDGEWINLKPLNTEGQGTADEQGKEYSLIQLAVPVGLGFRYKLAKNWDLAFEIGWRFTTTDYLDDVGGNYADPSVLSPTAQLLADRSVEGYVNDVTTETVDDLGLWTGTSVAGYGQSGDQRGDRKGRSDWYIVTGFHLTYIIPGRVICPKFRN